MKKFYIASISLFVIMSVVILGSNGCSSAIDDLNNVRKPAVVMFVQKHVQNEHQAKFIVKDRCGQLIEIGGCSCGIEPLTDMYKVGDTIKGPMNK